MTTANEYCNQIIEILRAFGVRTAYCSPGSRNVPLLIALEACEAIEKRISVDERSCAFQALGCALVGRSPVALVCTSGTAVLNYAPAIAEAYYAGVPLIVISADRPAEWIDQDDSQTIRQYGILDHIVKGSFDIRAIPEGITSEYTSQMKWAVNRIMNEAMVKATEGKEGPVHINVQLAEPLGELSDAYGGHERVVHSVSCVQSIEPSVMREIAETAISSKVLIVAGFGVPDHRLNQSIREMSAFPNVAVMAETIANVFDADGRASMIDSVLTVLSEKEREAMRPDIVISFGGALVSRMLKKYIRDYPPRRQISLGYSNYFGDCFQSLTDRIEIAPSRFFRHLAGAMRKAGRNSGMQNDEAESYSEAWRSMRDYAMQTSEAYIEASPWSDLKALGYVFRNLGNGNLFVSNGTAIRYSQLIPHTAHAEYCNRGVSGIDGSTATAAGGANAFKGDTMLVTGDMSWLYDSGASTLSSIPARMGIILIDNGGGGIFRFISSTSGLPGHFLDNYLCVSGKPDVMTVAAAYGIEVKECRDMKSLKAGMEWQKKRTSSPRMLIIHTPAETSAEVLKGYFRRTQKLK